MSVKEQNKKDFLFSQAIFPPETGNINIFCLISEFLKNLEKSQSKKTPLFKSLSSHFKQNKSWGVLGWQLFCSNVTTMGFCFSPTKVFCTQEVTNILLLHLKGRIQSTFVNAQTITHFLQWCTRELTDQWQSLGKHNKNIPIKTAPQINLMNNLP